MTARMTELRGRLLTAEQLRDKIRGWRDALAAPGPVGRDLDILMCLDEMSALLASEDAALAELAALADEEESAESLARVKPAHDLAAENARLWDRLARTADLLDDIVIALETPQGHRRHPEEMRATSLAEEIRGELGAVGTETINDAEIAP